MTYTCGSLFTGIGGIDLAFVAAGCEIAFQVEIDDFCRKVLKKNEQRYWPNATRFTDVRAVGGHNLPRVDILFGGFPCQDISVAGKGLGIKEGTRSGLWFEFARIIGELRPGVVLLENVPAILTRDGAVVIANLAAMGYVGHWGIISAAEAGAPHKRERWFCVAYATRKRLQTSSFQRGRFRNEFAATGKLMGNPPNQGLEVGHRCGSWNSQPAAIQSGAGQTQPRLGQHFTRLSVRLDRHRWPARPGQPQYTWEPPRVTDRTDNRANRLKALGNAVVPQVVYPIALAIAEWFDNA